LLLGFFACLSLPAKAQMALLPDLVLDDEMGRLYEPAVEFEMLFPVQLTEASALYRKGDYRSALLLLKRIDTLNIPDGTRDTRLLMMAESYRKLGLGAASVGPLRELLNDYTESPLRVFAVYRLQDHYYRERDLESCDSLGDLFGRQYPGHPLRGASLYLSAKGRIRAVRYSEAIAFCRRVPRESDFYASALFLHGLSLAAQGDSTGALLRLDAAAATEQDPALRDEAFLLQGDIYFRMRKYEAALRMYDRVAAKSRRTEDARLRKAFVHLELNQNSQALRMARAVLKDSPESRHVFEISLVLERAYRALGDERNDRAGLQRRHGQGLHRPAPGLEDSGGHQGSEAGSPGRQGGR